jgi:hypothetical protein
MEEEKKSPCERGWTRLIIKITVCLDKASVSWENLAQG